MQVMISRKGTVTSEAETNCKDESDSSQFLRDNFDINFK